MKKEQLKNVVVEHLVDETALPEVAHQTLTPVSLLPDNDSPEKIPSGPQTSLAAAVLAADRLFELEKPKI